MAQTAQKRKMSTTQIKLYADIVLFVAFLLVNIPQGTGIPFHEWVSFLFIIPLMVHILLDWPWIVSVTKRMFKRLPGEVRFNHIWDLLIFIMMVLALSTGVLISESALPAMGITFTIDPFWSALHDIVANLLMVLIGVHLAMHWRWVTTNIKKYFGRSQAKSSKPAAGGD